MRRCAKEGFPRSRSTWPIFFRRCRFPGDADFQMVPGSRQESLKRLAEALQGSRDWPTNWRPTLGNWGKPHESNPDCTAAFLFVMRAASPLVMYPSGIQNGRRKLPFSRQGSGATPHESPKSGGRVIDAETNSCDPLTVKKSPHALYMADGVDEDERAQNHDEHGRKVSRPSECARRIGPGDRRPHLADDIPQKGHGQCTADRESENELNAREEVMGSNRGQ